MITRLPINALKILESLYNRGPMGPSDISSHTKIPLRTVSFCLKRLIGHGFLKKTANLLDMRVPHYSLDRSELQNIFNNEESNPLMRIMPSIFDWKKTA